MPFIAFILAVLPLFATPAPSAAPRSPAIYAELKAKAEASYAEKSFRRAREAYEEAAKLDLPKDERRWVDFRIADSRWRELAPQESEESVKALKEIIRAADSAHDRVWAEAHESLGDYAIPQNRNGANYTEASTHYTAALDWWAASDDLPLARARYLAIVWRFSDRFRIPNELLANALTIAVTAEDRNHAHLLLGKQLIGEGKPEAVERGLEHLDAIIRAGHSEFDYAEALFTSASTLANLGSVVVNGNQTEYRKDYKKALELYRRLVTECKPGETPHYREAQQAIDEITKPMLSVYVGGSFLPDTDPLAFLRWRNVDGVELTLYAIDLTKDVAPKASPNYNAPLVDTVVVDPRRMVRQWTFTTPRRDDYLPGVEKLRITPRLPAGAYVLTAKSGAVTARDLLLVTDTALVTHQLKDRLHIYVANVMSGAPVAGARVKILAPRGTKNTYQTIEGATNASGIAELSLEKLADDTGWGYFYVTASDGPRQSFDIWPTEYEHLQPFNDVDWHIYAFTDRTAYRPGETVHWKGIVRTRTITSDWRTPAGQTLDWRVTGPRSEEIASGTATLNAFGSLWADIPLTPAMALGSYRIWFSLPQKKDQSIGVEELFQLEEYKLPEFRVSVKMPQENGKTKVFRLGDTVEATVEASYYFGGAVADANVEVEISEFRYQRWWTPRREFSWYYLPDEEYRGDHVKTWTETLRTDANGRAVLRIPTSRDGEGKHFYLTAKVTDASRREVSGQGDFAVGKQRYSVLAWAEHVLRRPNERASIAFNAADANDEPVQTTGTVKLVRRAWNRETKAYTEEQVMTTTLSTDAKGTATFSFTPSSTGFYTAKWTSADEEPGRAVQARDLVTAEGSVWVSDRTTRDLGYHTGGLDLIVDSDTFREGETASVLIVTPASGRWVLLSTATATMESELLRLDGTVKLLQIPIGKQHIPNFFITASSLFDRQLSTAAKDIDVPPADRFMKVEVTGDRAEYEPRQKGSLHITTRDDAGKPVAAEVSVSVSDDAVTAIAGDRTIDPRRYFYSDHRGASIAVSSSLTQRGARPYYVDLDAVPTARDPWTILQEAPAVQTQSINVGGIEGGVEGGVVGGVEGGVSQSAPLESITVTGAAADMAFRIAPEKVAAAVQVRHDFRSTAFWQPDVMTNANGEATVAVDYPEALTMWKTTVRAATTSAQFGIASAEAKTTLPLLVRLQAPRFFVAGDRAVISAVVNNTTSEAMQVAPAIEVEGVTLEGRGEAAAIDVPAHGERRVDWTVVADRAGEAKLRVIGRANGHSDGMEKTFTVYEHGVDKLIARSTKVRAAESVVHLDLPHERRATALTVRVAPSLAVTMLDALPYLIDYPYGCTEQTMSRFLPAAAVARTLRESGLDPKEVEQHMFGGIEPSTAAATHPKGRTDLSRLDEVTAASMNRLYEFQHDDGGWGWWQQGQSDDYMTAYVVWGFSVARKGGLTVSTRAIDHAVEFLQSELDKARRERGVNDEVWMLHAITAWSSASTPSQTLAFEDAWKRREQLTPFGRALLAIVAQRGGDKERAGVLVRNLENGVQIDRSPDDSMATAHWGSGTFWWHWWEGPVETTAFALQALVTIDPKNPLIEPTMNWLVKNRRGAQWNNTRDTAIALLALNDYLRVSGELKPDVGYELAVNGHAIASRPNGAAETFTIDPELVRDSNDITIRRTHGGGPLYVAAEGRFVSLEEPVKAAGHEIYVKRDYYRIIPRPTLLKGNLSDKRLLADNDTLTSGERVEVVVTVEAKNDYDYLMLEDLKPAGLEATILQSGYGLSARSADGKQEVWLYQELRDRKVAMFIDHLPQGTWTIRYELRAEVPGTFHALPLLGEAMYVPEVRANGEEVHVGVR